MSCEEFERKNIRLSNNYLMELDEAYFDSSHGTEGVEPTSRHEDQRTRLVLITVIIGMKKGPLRAFVAEREGFEPPSESILN